MDSGPKTSLTSIFGRKKRISRDGRVAELGGLRS
jgi:uncharacterized protein Veg